MQLIIFFIILKTYETFILHFTSFIHRLLNNAKYDCINL